MIIAKYVYYVTFRGCPLIRYWISWMLVPALNTKLVVSCFFMIWWWWFISTSEWIRPHYAFGARQLIILTSRLSTIYFLYIFNICHFPNFFVAKFQEFEDFFFQGNWQHQRKKCVHSLFMNVIFVAKKWKNLASSWLWKKTHILHYQRIKEYIFLWRNDSRNKE